MPKARPVPLVMEAAKSFSDKYRPERKRNGQFQAGWSGNPGGDAGRGRRALNIDTIAALHEAFRRGGRKAIDQVMRTQPALFVKFLVLLVPRELEVTHSAGVKAMSDEQIDQAIEAIQAMLDARAGGGAKVIEAVAEPEPKALPAPKRKRATRRDMASNTSTPSSD